MDFNPAISYLPFLMTGVQVALAMSAVSITLAAIGGLGVVYLRLSPIRALRSIGTGYVIVAQSIPFFALLLWVYFVLPAIFGIRRPDTFIFACATLVIAYAPFFGEVYRAGILAVPTGQRDAALSTGMTERQAMRAIVLPQAFRSSVPPLTSLCVSAVKDTAIIGPVLGVQEIIWHTTIVQGQTLRPLEAFLVAAVLYVLITFPLTLLGNYVYGRMRLDRDVRVPGDNLSRYTLGRLGR